jgi:tRNA(fMet)-specific endonuclease VapC
MLDTDTCIYLIARKFPQLEAKAKAQVPGSLLVSAITAAELAFGVAKSQRHAHNQAILVQFLGGMTILPWPVQAMWKFAEMKQHLQSFGKMIGPYDLLIAAHAVFEDITLVTNNVREFERVPGLKLENWVERGELV